MTMVENNNGLWLIIAIIMSNIMDYDYYGLSTRVMKNCNYRNLALHPRYPHQPKIPWEI